MPPSHPDRATVTITSFNTRWGVDDQHRPYDLGAVVRGFETDVIALQEVWDPHDGTGFLGPLADELGYHLVEAPLAGSTLHPHPQITRDPARIDGTWGIALLSRVPVHRARIVDLGRLVDRWDVATRAAIVADLDLGGRTVTLAAVHLSFAMPNTVAQLRRLNEVLPPTTPSVVVGDCNLWGPAAATGLGGRRRAVRGRTYPAHRPHSQLDHVLVSPGIVASGGRVLPASGSDHLPIRATISVPPG